jgi:hypothetical protein
VVSLFSVAEQALSSCSLLHVHGADAKLPYAPFNRAGRDRKATSGHREP